MSAILFEIFKDALTASAAALVFVVGQGVLRFIIEPAVDLRKTIAEVGFLLIYRAHVLVTPKSVSKELLVEVQDESRRLAAMLESRAQIVPFLGIWSRIGWLPDRRGLRQARGNLIFFSNNDGASTRDDRQFIRASMNELREHLGLAEME